MHSNFPAFTITLTAITTTAAICFAGLHRHLSFQMEIYQISNHCLPKKRHFPSKFLPNLVSKLPILVLYQ